VFARLVSETAGSTLYELLRRLSFGFTFEMKTKSSSPRYSLCRGK